MPVRIENAASTRTSPDNMPGTARTATHLSTNIYIAVNGLNVGAVQTLTVNEERAIKMIDEVGTDGHIDSAPNVSTKISGTCNRIRFDGQRIAEAFMRGFVHVHAQRIPFDITIFDNFQGSNDDSTIVTTIRNVWINKINYTYQVSDFVIAEEMGWQAEGIGSQTQGGSAVVGPVNNRGIPMSGDDAINPFEQSADTGEYRGALDAPGLLDAFNGAGGRTL